jgi:hypothetical protein
LSCIVSRLPTVENSYLSHLCIYNQGVLVVLFQTEVTTLLMLGLFNFQKLLLPSSPLCMCMSMCESSVCYSFIVERGKETQCFFVQNLTPELNHNHTVLFRWDYITFYSNPDEGYIQLPCYGLNIFVNPKFIYLNLNT